MRLITDELLRMNQRELSSLTEKELRQVVSTVRSTARKRYERLAERDIYSPAMRAFREGARGDSVIPTIRGMDITQLRNEFKRYKQFLTAKSSTVKGAKEIKSKLQNAIEDVTGVRMTQDKAEEFIKIYDQAKWSEVGLNVNYRQVMNTVEEIYETNPEWDSDKIIKVAERRLIEEYERENPTTQYGIHPSRAL